tara:strand:- start:1220 stop:1645 length:426 start_codon:yes stop_codon:yes gene_type:complete
MTDKKKLLDKMMISQKDTLASAIGLEITDFGEKYVCGKVPVDKRTKQPFGLLHGGASVVLAETLGSIAGNRMVDMDTEMVVGIEINANHLRSVQEGWIYGKAMPINIGKRIQVWEIRITDKLDQMVCLSRLTVAVVKRKRA